MRHLAGLVLVSQLLAQSSRPTPELSVDDFRTLPWRSIGPANMGGRVAAIALVPGSRKSFYVGFGTGGLWKTENLGVTFTPVFDEQPTLSIGAVAVGDQKGETGKGKVVWVGTGEGNGRNSSSWGKGVFSSTDAGATFASRGLEATADIPRLALDPRDPEVCYVAALGRLWGPNPERGVFKTTDGGKSWQHVLKVDSTVGACDVVVDPGNPDVVYAALYARLRTPWSFTGNSDKGGIWKSTDAGKTWQKLTKGLPARTGRIGLTVFPRRTSLLFAVVESDEGGTGRDPVDDDRSPRGGLFRSEDGGASWTRTSNLNFRPFYFGRIAVDPEDEKRVYLPGWDLAVSDDGGRTFRRSGSENVHVDFHAIVVNPIDPEQILVGNDGGVYVSHDRAKTWDFLDRMAVGQFYKVATDLSEPYRIGGGLQDNGTWLGPSRTAWLSDDEAKDGIRNEDWRFVFGGDGFGFAFDPQDKDLVYATSQGGAIARVRLDTNQKKTIRPTPREGQSAFRFAWDAPFVLSRFDPSVLYLGGNRLFELTEKGDAWRAISGDLSHRDVDRILTVGSSAETYGTVVALAESKTRRGTLWAGTDDGRLWLTRDTGGSWKEVTPAQAKGLYCACLEPSAFSEEVAYATIDGHRSDVYRPILLVTRDGGSTWAELGAGLPQDMPARVVREDPGSEDVLWVGTENALFVSLDRGTRWTKVNGKGLPPVRIDDLQIHPRERDLIVATHGRSLWVLDDASPFAHLAAAGAERPLVLFPPRPAKPVLFSSRGYGSGHALFRAKNPPAGAPITFWLREAPRAGAKLAIVDAHGVTLRELEGAAYQGMNRITWDLCADKRHVVPDTDAKDLGQTQFVPAGDYVLKLTVGDKKADGKITVLAAPGLEPR